MTAFLISDSFYRDPRVRSLMAQGVEGASAVGLWTAAGVESVRTRTHGLVTETALVGVFGSPDFVRECAALLVTSGLWHSNGHTCQKCPKVPANAWRFHDWHQPANVH